MTSGSGSGVPRLATRTLAKDVKLLNVVGKGRYGDVRKAKYHGQKVAVKIFSSRDERSWLRERHIYENVLTRHENVLCYYASDMTSSQSCTQMWLMTQYHENGSLYDYLQRQVLDPLELLRLAYSASSGLAYLHTEIVGTHDKLAVAHRDVKSKNILIMDNGNCCVADMGLAVTFSSDRGILNLGDNPKVGTKRYMPPEVLTERFNQENFDSFRKMDVYSFGLVLWEIARRCKTEYADADEYQLPYFGKVPNDPSVDEMRKIVVEDKIRPQIPKRLKNHEILRPYCKVIRECWSENPSSRLSMLRVKKTLMKMVNKLEFQKSKDLASSNEAIA
ncbi:uncharacterized protein TRIADDRAFT_22452 [Trichoplax adhaerens]|uniref:receptor protein serine/threonine kinase n=1 Tax=Trichoplax adhaerens TaxID=10228 RepID=B3RRD7_TRIAD|nr:hypothetical protein TRIADDRAFT_22452 [Trichoplax adhaerens]EDV26326.1 hypothetical protein TRIADDRAFT_22452 [Trichoplax adhaerens]|eukprot:XP_002110322.1 hypothetical protein TRIADDRAFT_22452 [Trichoplax adhaerens]